MFMKGLIMEFIKEYYKELLLGVLIILVIGLYGFNIYELLTKEENIPIESNVTLEKKEEVKEEPIKVKKEYVEIKGYVNKPGVYAITDDTIINDIVAIAGGFKKGAYTKNINLSKKVVDEMVIVVYSEYEYKQIKAPSVIYIEKECSCKDYDISSCLDDKNSVIKPGENEEDNNDKKDDNKENNYTDENKENTKININTASEKELMTLNGIGESKAKAIIEYRKENGNFKETKDITKVSGISEKTYENIKDSITV